MSRFWNFRKLEFGHKIHWFTLCILWPNWSLRFWKFRKLELWTSWIWPDYTLLCILWPTFRNSQIFINLKIWDLATKYTAFIISIISYFSKSWLSDIMNFGHFIHHFFVFCFVHLSRFSNLEFGHKIHWFISNMVISKFGYLKVWIFRILDISNFGYLEYGYL